jgi:Zn-dependent oligopeptidase
VSRLLEERGSSTSDPAPPATPPSWEYTPEQVTKSADDCIASSDELLTEVAALPKEQRTFENVIRRMGLHEVEVDSLAEPALFLQYVSQDEGIRNASVDSDKKLQVSGQVVLQGY